MTQIAISTSEMQLLNSAERMFAPLVREGVFESFERAFRTLLLDYVERQIVAYSGKASQFEARHQMNFEDFTTTLRSRATPEAEEEWQDWEAALIFLRKWQKIRTQVSDGVSA